MDKSVLVVDDDWRVCDILEEVLGDMGIGVRQALKTEEANRLLSESNYALVMVDVTLGNENGTNLARDLRDKGQQVILITGKDDLWIRDKVPQGIPVLRKPFRIDDLTLLIDQFGLEGKVAI